MARPALGPLKKGDIVIVRSRGNRASERERVCEMRVATIGPKWVGLLTADSQWAGTPDERYFVRRFLLADQREGVPGKRVGYGASFATREQYEYDLALEQAARVITDCGLDVRCDSVFYGDEGIFRLASILRQAITEPSWRRWQ